MGDNSTTLVDPFTFTPVDSTNRVRHTVAYDHWKSLITACNFQGIPPPTTGINSSHKFLNAVCSLLEPIKKENCLEPEEEKTISVILRMQIDDSYKLLPQIIGIRPATLATDQLTMAIGIYL